jgi:hypothetical protein
MLCGKRRWSRKVALAQADVTQPRACMNSAQVDERQLLADAPWPGIPACRLINPWPTTVDGELNVGHGTDAPRPRFFACRCGFPCLCPVRPAAEPPARWVGPSAASAGGVRHRTVRGCCGPPIAGTAGVGACRSLRRPSLQRMAAMAPRSTVSSSSVLNGLPHTGQWRRLSGSCVLP